MPSTYILAHTPTLGEITKPSPHSTLFGTKKRFQVDENIANISLMGPQQLKDKIYIIKEEQRIFSESQMLPS